MKIEKTKLDGVLLIRPELVSAGAGEVVRDERGEFVEAYQKEKMKQGGIDIEFLEDDISVSKKNVLRGMHGDDRTWKLVTCLAGKTFFVVIDADRNSSKFGAWQSFDLDDTARLRILVPPLHAIGYVALTDALIISYKQSALYRPGGQFTFRWDDPKFGIPWPVAQPILSIRDAAASYLS
jgi:dTDP-4-dehydrorhamnose 3,5-epimerase